MYNILFERDDVNNPDALKKYIDICSTDNNDDYLEEHHILPKYLYPEFKDLKVNEWNSVKLSFYNHIMAHYYFALAFSTRQAWCPVNLMLGRDKMRSLTESDVISLAKITAESKSAMSTMPVSDETREKLRAASTGRQHTQEAKDKISKSKKGKPLSEEHNKAIREAQKGENHPNYGRLPWLCSATKVHNTKDRWLKIDEYYDFWIAHNKIGEYALNTKYEEAYGFRIKGIRQIVEFFKKHSDPRKMDAWAEFKNKDIT